MNANGARSESNNFLIDSLGEAEEMRGKAEAAFRQAIALDPGHARAYPALARLLEMRGDETGARAARSRAAALAPCSAGL